MSNINREVWKSTGPCTIIFGTIMEESHENTWTMVKVDWHLPNGRVTDATGWQKLANLGRVENIREDLASFSSRTQENPVDAI